MAETEFPAEIRTLRNGLTVVFQRTPSPVIAVDVWARAGAIAEPEMWSGMAHFLEHMVFKGSEEMPPGYFDYVIESYGGVANAATSHDYAHFFINTTLDHLPTTLPCLSELLVRAAIPDDEFVRERDVVLEEIRQAHDDPDWLGFQQLMELMFQNHPYGRPVLGTPDHLLRLSPDEMRAFHHSHYQPHNLTVVMVGDVPRDMAFSLIGECFDGFASAPSFPQLRIDAEPPIVGIRRDRLELPRLELARLMLGWIGPGVDQLADAYGLDLLSVLLAGGRTSRLVRELREERQLVQEIDSSFSLQRDSSLFTITAWLEPQYLDQVEALIGDRISELNTTQIPEAELARVQRQLCNDFAFSTETSSQLAGLYGYYSTIARTEDSVTYPERIANLHPELLQAIATRYLSPYHYAAVVMTRG